MPRWMRPEEEMPKCDAGDRVIGIVRCRDRRDGPIVLHVVVIEATEDGWDDLTDNGYTVEDCELWSMERDVVQIADVIRAT